ncbi:LOW QUALITY PROTEIN: hypothetical protein PanWU01x14_072010 [Parasponia andersonii]|uniref:Uncharacterized protein n=1 Tax=Parasponia andersonii TaxID=3476 RepID=A0A2P5DEL4_PARAD|nr:LOW QUALITY PROTEIN: hypothetical protein PanWU01x14_072010 [Parasponia andersonii]
MNIYIYICVCVCIEDYEQFESDKTKPNKAFSAPSLCLCYFGLQTEIQKLCIYFSLSKICLGLGNERKRG